MLAAQSSASKQPLLSVAGRRRSSWIGTLDEFVKIAVSLSQPDIDAVLCERTALLAKYAGELRASTHLSGARSTRRAAVSKTSRDGAIQPDHRTLEQSRLPWSYRSGAKPVVTKLLADLQALSMAVAAKCRYSI
jgi:hypothetical protein